jgi:aspartyl/asparaginyl-tRNA synthetase
MTQIINPKKYTTIVAALRSFFLSKGFLEVHTQNRLSILAACEDPTTVATYDYAGETWPLPQTGQMWLEYELLNDPGVPGFFCVSTSYRQEPNIIEGRHDLIFPMFEFEFPGNLRDLMNMEVELCEHLGYDPLTVKSYSQWSEEFNTTELTHEHEQKMEELYGPCIILNFPNHTSPFWNMKQNGDGTAAKIDVILGGMETIGSAERSTNKAEMRDTFHTISGGKYASLLHEKFGYDRVEKELKEFLNHDFMPRVGGGIGLTRLIKTMSFKDPVKINSA